MSTSKRFIGCLLLILIGLPAVEAQLRNTTDGANAGAGITTGDDSVFLGYDAGRHVDTGSQNVIIGSQAAIGGLDTTLGEILGANGATLLSNQEFNGSRSVIIGYRAAWQSPNAANENVIIGNDAGRFNQASDQVIIGDEAGESNTTGSDNTFIGRRAGSDNTTGSANTFVGAQSGTAILGGDENTAFGRSGLGSQAENADAGDSYANTVIGNFAGANLGTSAKNWNHTMIGVVAGYDTETGQANTFLGAFSAVQNKAGSYNTFAGMGAGANNNTNGESTTGNRNTYLGMASGMSNTRGTDNVMIGAMADSGKWQNVNANTIELVFDASSSTALSSQAAGVKNDASRGVTIGSLSASQHHDTVTIGYSADGTAIRTIALGSGAQATHADAIAIGYQAASHGANIAVLGNATTQAIEPGADATTTLGSNTFRWSRVNTEALVTQSSTASDAHIDLQADAATDNNDRWRLTAANGGNLSIASFATGAYTPGLELSNAGNLTVTGEVAINSDVRLKTQVAPIRNAAQQIRRLQGKQYEWKPAVGRDSQTHFGLIAQEVREVFPHVVTQQKNETLSVRYHALIPVLLEAVKEQQQIIQNQRNRIEALKNRNTHEISNQIKDIHGLIDRHLAAVSSGTLGNSQNH